MKTLLKISTILLAVCLTSCSTIFRTKTQTINVFSNAQKATVTVNDSVYSLPAKVKLLRSKKPVTLSYQSDNKQFDTIVLGKSGPLFYLGNLVTSPFFGVGYWVDLMNQEKLKRNQEKEFKRYNPAVGKFRFFIAPPTLSLIGFSKKNPNIEQFNNFVGGVGFGFGGDYFYKENRFLTLELSNRVNQFDDFWWSGHDVLARKLDVSFRKAHKINRLEYSYGISCIYTDYEYALPWSSMQQFWDDDERNYSSASYSTIGLSSLINYQLTSVMFVGIRYNPSVYSFRTTGNGFDYEHVISIDYRLKF
ncbi:hypothetical protein SAMN05421741_12812 [Paenimyroides ummariense]|uniref:Outer membrane protein beta-barrel domain-containing protein n=1 Tax=Paenimyroides ummariense TaxID=913024 RepID=A0A1I5FGG7_9FLAO|nr:hypothetical protein [Paenimyroides ummariense]SFO22847.1 hypothetical protein SAMN05421741_12812 [Paenimyroides ummariense]